jgi:IS4 transposase
MKRWCIENTYKQFNAFRIRTISTNFIVRYFFFLFRVLLYNLWKFYNAVMNIESTFKEFVFKLVLASANINYKKEMEEAIDMCAILE